MSKEQKTSNKPLSTALIKLMVGQGVSMIGDSFTGLALMWFIVQTGSPMQVGINLALAFIPSVVFAPFIGSIVDRMSRKKLLISSDVLRFFFRWGLNIFHQHRMVLYLSDISLFISKSSCSACLHPGPAGSDSTIDYTRSTD